MSDEQVMLTDELRARIGQTRTYTAPEPLGAAAIRYFAQAVGDLNPLYLDRAFAQEHGHRDVVAPPTLLAETNQYVVGEPDADGYLGHSWHLEVPDSRLVRGGNAYEFHSYAHPDTVVTATWRIAGITERRTGAGVPMLVVDSEAEFADADGRLLLRNAETLVFTSLRPVPDGQAPSARTPRPAADESSPAGAAIAPLERTIALTDMVAYAGSTWDWHRLHYDPAYLEAKKLPAPVVDGQVFGALLVEAVQDDLGPDATVREASFRFKNLVFAGETVRVSGHVVDEVVVDGLRRLEVAATVDVVGGDRPRPAATPCRVVVEVPA